MQESSTMERVSSALELSATRRAVVALVLILVLVMSVGVVLNDHLLIALNAACVFVLTIPWWGQKRVDWLSMWSILTLSTVATLLLRSVYIIFDIPSRYDIENSLLLGRSKQFLLPVMPIMLAGLATLTAGYLEGPRSSASIPLCVFRLDRWNDNRLLVLICVMLLISVVAFAVFVQRTGGIDLQRISAKRTAARGLELEDSQAYGYLRWMTDLLTLADLGLLARILSNEPQSRRYLLLLLPALAVSVSFHVYASSLAGVVFPLFQALALAYYLSCRRLKLRGLVILGIIGLIGFGWLTQLRREGGLARVLPTGLNMVRWLDSFVVTQQLLDVSKTAHILDAIPEVLDYPWGRTLVVWMVAWIPRSLWPAKPVVSLGHGVGVPVFNSADKLGGDVAPGLFAELYWNFSFPGSVIGSFVVGYLIRLYQVNFGAHAHNRGMILIHVSSFMMPVMTLVGGSVSKNICVPMSGLQLPVRRNWPSTGPVIRRLLGQPPGLCLHACPCSGSGTGFKFRRTAIPTDRARFRLCCPGACWSWAIS